MKERLKETGLGLLSSFLLSFMIFVFGPAEIFFANVTEFTFLYQDFALQLAWYMLEMIAVCTLIILIMPGVVRRILISVLFGAAVAGYLQVMFWNKGLDLLGMLPEGYSIHPVRAVLNLIFWIVILGATFVLLWRRREWWKRMVRYISVFLLLVQGVALGSLYVTADESAYQYPDEAWVLSGEDQFTVSSNQNIILFIVDHMGSGTMDGAIQDYPDILDELHDFIYYPYDVCSYYSTYPSLPHMLTGCDLDMSMTVDDWLSSIWADENVGQLYENLQAENYAVNLYTPELMILTGTHDPSELLGGKVSNLVNTTQERELSYDVLYGCMVKMSCYRLTPEYCKPYFYTQMSEYADVVEIVNNPMQFYNWDFKEKLLEDGLTLSGDSNYFIIQHLSGLHDYNTDEDGDYNIGYTTSSPAVKGCMVIIGEYLRQLKELGVYDNTAVLITADHGHGGEPAVPLLIKDFGTQNDTVTVLDAPITHCDLLSTLAELAGVDGTGVGSGRSVLTYEEGEERERWFWSRDYRDGYPDVQKYSGERTGSDNVFKGYLYEGGVLVDDPDEIVPMVDSYF